MTKAENFFNEVKNKRIAVCGIGHNNLPVIHQFLQAGASVMACDRRTEEQLGDAAGQLRQAGATLFLGEDYLNHLDVDMILRTPGMKPYLPPFEQARARGIPVTSEMELFFDLCPAPIYAVTGSDGKTTTTTLMAGLLEAAGKTVFLGGNIGRPLLPHIGEIQPSHAAVVELSSFQLTRMRKRPQVAVITNVTPNHLDWHTDMQEYSDAKRNLIAYQTAADHAVLNMDNAVTAAFAESCPGSVYGFSRLHPVERGAWADADGELYLRTEEKTVRILNTADIRLPGAHNVENYLAAIAAVGEEVPASVIRTFAGQFGGVPHRCELVRERQGVRWYNDSIGTSPTRTIAGLRAFDRPVILIAGGYDKHIPYAPLGEAAADTVKTAILMGDTAPAIEAAIRAYSLLPIIRVTTMEEAVETAASLTKEGDIVFLSPASASFDNYRNFEERGEHFKQLVNGKE